MVLFIGSTVIFRKCLKSSCEQRVLLVGCNVSTKADFGFRDCHTVIMVLMSISLISNLMFSLSWLISFSAGPGAPIITTDNTVIINVNTGKPVIAPIGAKITTVVNATVIMRCPNQGSPQPVVTWNHDQRFIAPGGKYLMNESSLVIRGVRLKDAGRYKCTASNRFGRDVESLYLTVAGKDVVPLDSTLLSRYFLFHEVVEFSFFF